jgi:hypothetical protein
MPVRMGPGHGQGTEPPIPIPIPIPDLPGIGGGPPIPDLHPHPRSIPDLPKSGIPLSTIEYCKGVEFRLPQCLTLIVNCHQSSLIFEGRQCPMTPLTTAAAATRVIPSRLPALEKSCILAHDLSVRHAAALQLSDAHHHRRNRPRSASVTRPPATAPRRASSASSRDTSDPSSSGDDSH